jgi:hypothetical protein
VRDSGQVASRLSEALPGAAVSGWSKARMRCRSMMRASGDVRSRRKVARVVTARISERQGANRDDRGKVWLYRGQVNRVRECEGCDAANCPAVPRTLVSTPVMQG